MKLQRKLTIILSGILTIIFCIAAFIISVRINNYNHKLTENLSTQLIESKANEAGAWLNQRIRELHTISRTPTVVSMEDDALKKYITQLSNDMDSYYGNNYGTFSINRLDGLEYITEYQTIDVSDRDYYNEILITDKEYVISKPIISKTDQSLITVACYPIFDKSSEKIGFVAAAISLKKLTEITDNLIFYNGESMILDSSGAIYTHLNKNLSSSLKENIIKHIPSNFIDKISLYDMKEGDKDYVVFYVPIPNSPNWFLSTVVERAELYKDTKMLTNSLVSIWILLLFIAISISYFVGKLATNRIKILSNAMQDIRMGKMETSITLNGDDELSSLADDFNGMVQEINSLMKKIYQQQKEEGQRELQVLQSQINPHFLYNTLDTLQWKALEYNAVELSEMIVSLSSFFRISLSKGKEIITLEKELEHVKNYLFIQQFRYNDILNYEINCDPKFYSYQLPKIIIQPLVENAIYHGIKPKLISGTVKVSVFEEENFLNIVVEDDGVGISSGKLRGIRRNLEEHFSGNNYGLYNVNRRLFLHYGQDSKISITSTENQGTCITMKVLKNMEE